MGTRTCPHCGSFVPVSNLRCHQCKQLLPSMLQRAHDPESERPMYDPDRLGTGSLVASTGPLRSQSATVPTGTGKLAKILQTFGRK